MGFDFGGLAGGLLSGLFGLGAADKQNSAAQAMSEQQHKWNVEDYQHRYQWAAEDMRKAGLNPILAATQGIGGHINGVSAQSLAMAPTPDFGSILNSSKSIANQKEIAQKGLELQERGTAVQEKDAETHRKEAETHRMEVLDQISNRERRFSLDQEIAKFDMQLKEAWQNFEIDRKTQETGAYIRHLAAQDANLSTMAQVALRDVKVKEILADLAEKNGIAQRDLWAAEAVMKGEQEKYLIEQGNTERAKQELIKAETALTNYKRSVAGIETMSDIMKGVLSVAIGAKIGIDMVGTGSNRIGF